MWDDRYAESGFAYGLEPNDFLVEVAHLIPPGPVLFVAEGEGRNATWFAGRHDDVHAVDASEVAVAKTLGLAAERGVTVHAVQGDLADFDLGTERWAGIVGIFCHLPPPMRAKLHADIVGALKPGGLYIAEAYTPRQLAHGTGGPPVLPLLFDPDIIRAELAGLVLDRFEEVEREVVEGRFHTGLAAVLQVVARRP